MSDELENYLGNNRWGSLCKTVREHAGLDNTLLHNELFGIEPPRWRYLQLHCDVVNDMLDDVAERGGPRVVHMVAAREHHYAGKGTQGTRGLAEHSETLVFPDLTLCGLILCSVWFMGAGGAIAGDRSFARLSEDIAHHVAIQMKTFAVSAPEPRTVYRAEGELFGRMHMDDEQEDRNE